MLGLDVESKSIDNVGSKIKKAHRKRLEDAMQKGFSFSQEQAPEDRGTLRQSGFPPEWTSNGTIRFGYTAPYSRPMEYGTDPFWAPIRPLKEWAERVSGDPGLGYYVQWKIAQEGIDAQPYVRPGREVTKRYLDSHGMSDYLSDQL